MVDPICQNGHNIHASQGNADDEADSDDDPQDLFKSTGN